MCPAWKDSLINISDISDVQLAFYNEVDDNVLEKAQTSLPLNYFNALQELWVFFPNPVDLVRVEISQTASGAICPRSVYYNGETTNLVGTGGIMYAYDQALNLSYDDLPNQKSLGSEPRFPHLSSLPDATSQYAAQCEFFLHTDVPEGAMVIARPGITSILLTVWDFTGHHDNDINIENIYVNENNETSTAIPTVTGFKLVS